jgi:hypothetical protein
MSVELISAIAGIILSLAFEFIPGFEGWYGQFDVQKKRLFMVAALLLVVGGAYGLSCANLLTFFPCTLSGAWLAVQAFIAALVANQAVHLVLKKE